MNKKKTDPLIDHFSKERFFEMPNAIVFDYDNEQAINEMYLSGNYGIGSKSSIAYVGSNFDARHLKASSVYGNVKNYSDGIKKSGVTNDAVKMELTASFVENPREYTNRAISTILNNVSKYYSLTEEEEKIFKSPDKDGFEARAEMTKMLEEKGLLGDKKMVEALKACDFLLKTCAKVEDEYKESYGRTIERELEEQLEEKCFSKHNAWFDFSEISDSEKKRIYNLFVENQEFVPPDNFNNFTPEEKNKFLKTVASQDDLIFELRKYFKKDIYPPEAYIENVYLKKSKNQKNLENYIYNEVKRAQKIAKQNLKEMTTSEIDEIKKSAKKEFIEVYKKEDIRNSYINSQMFLATSSFAKQVFSINSLYKNTKKAIEDSSKINKNIRGNEDFRFLYEQMSKATKALSIDGSGAKEYELKKIQKEILFRYNNNSDFKKLIKDAESFHRDISGESKDFEKLLKGGAMSPSDFKSFSSSVLEESLKRTFDNLQDKNKITFTLDEKKVVQKNLIELSRKIAEGKEDRITKPFSWNEIVSIYDDFQEKNILEITKNRIKNTRGLDDNTIESLIGKIDNQLKGKTKTSYMPTGELMDDVVDIMNFENIANNKIVQDSIELDEIDSVVQQSLRGDAESAVFRDIAKDVFVKNKKYAESKKKDMSHDARIREVAGHYYSDYANSLMKNSIIGLASKRETFQNFSSCVKGASVMQRNMDTKLSNTTNCLKEFKNSLKKDADEFQREISASLQGVGALNPFAHIAQVVAISRKLMAERIEANMREIADSINGISKEVATAETEIERRARNTILMAKSDGNVNIQSVHNSEKDELADKLKQEYITREIVDFKEAKTEFSDKKALDILEEYQIKHRDLDKSKLQEEQQEDITGALGGVIASMDGTYTQQELSKKEEQLPNQKEGSELNQDNAEELSNQEYVSNTDAVESKDSLVNEDGVGKKEKLSAFNSAMIEDAILKMDKIQKKMAEMSLASGNNYTHEEFLNGASSSEVTAERLGFTLSSKEERKELGLESWESKEMRDWMRENDISKELLEKSLAKGHKVIEQEKLALNYQLIIKSLEEMRDKGGADAVRPESKLNDIIKEVKKLFSEDGKKMSKLEKRNTLSSAVNILHGSVNYKKTMETMFSTSSMETESVKSEQNSEISIFGVADKEKAYILKVHKEQKILEKKRAILKEKYLSENIHVFPNDVKKYRKKNREDTEGKSYEDVEKMVKREKEDTIEGMFRRAGFEDLSYKADIELLRGTKMVGSETSLNNWSDLLENSTNFTTYNNGVRDINQEMAQINNSAVDYTAESRGDVGRGGFVAPDDNDYAPSK